LEEIQDSQLLKHWYLGGRPSYAHASGPAYDMVVPLQYTLNETLHYCPMLVSVKKGSSFGEKQRKAAIEAMQHVFTSGGIATGVCMLLLIGLDNPMQESSSSSFQFELGKVSTVESWYVMRMILERLPCVRLVGGMER
jgi:hypothetical protein